MGGQIGGLPLYYPSSVPFMDMTDYGISASGHAQTMRGLRADRNQVARWEYPAGLFTCIRYPESASGNYRSRKGGNS